VSTEFRVADTTAVSRRGGSVTALALDGRLDPQPIVIRDSGITIFDALGSWTTIADLAHLVAEQFSVQPADVEPGIRSFVNDLCDQGIVVHRSTEATPDAEVHD